MRGRTSLGTPYCGNCNRLYEYSVGEWVKTEEVKVEKKLDGPCQCSKCSEKQLRLF